MRFRLLGTFEAVDGGHSVAVGRRRERRLLAVLLLEPDQVVPADRLVELLWGGRPPEHARRTLHAHVARLRATLARYPEAPEIVTAGAGYALAVDPARVDVHCFCNLVQRARQEAEPARRSKLLAQALGLWRGPLLADLADEPVREWFGVALDELRVAATEDWLAAQLALGRHQEVTPDLARLVAEQPTREKLLGLWMQALYRSGRTADALAAFAELRERLAEATGAEPGRDLRELHTAILRHDPALDLPAAEPLAAAPIPAQLPPDLATFTGRAQELDRLDALLPGTDTHQPATVVISAITGMAGVGKTTVAVHWAHRVRDRYPDGQLYLNLRGYDPSGVVLRPVDAVRQLLTALEVPPARIPPDLNSRVGLYRSLMVDRRILVLLDNARDADQIRPLLPSAPGCLTVVTSRSQLAGLAAVDGAQLVPVSLLPPAEAAQLLARRVGAVRVAAEGDAVTEIVNRCGRLPLALAIVAARAVAHPEFPLAALARELRDASGRLDALHGVDPASDARTVFSWSYTSLEASSRELFRLLGLHPGPDFDAAAVASLAGVALPIVRRRLAKLTDAHLVTEHRPGRYAMHDLLRVCAAELVQAVDSAAQRRAALRRMLDHYLHTAHAAAVLRDPHRVDPISLDPAAPGVTPEHLAGGEHALAWLTVEHPVLTTAVPLAASHGFDSHAWQLAWALAQFLNRHGRWDDLLAVQRTALAAAARLGDRTGQAHAHRFLALAHFGRGAFAPAREHYRRASDLFEALDDPAGQGYAHLGINIVYDREGRHEAALPHARQALDLFRAAGDRAGQAKALNGIGWLSAQLGDLRAAVEHCGEALAIHREIGDDWGAAHNWDSLGYARHRLGEHTEAAACYTNALDLFRQAGDNFFTASTLTRLGDARQAGGDPGGARRAWQEAVHILDQLDHPDAAGVRARLSREPGTADLGPIVGR